MTVRIYLSKEVRSSVQHILDYFMNIEELPRFHPEYVKNVRIIHGQEAIMTRILNLNKKLHFMVRRLNP